MKKIVADVSSETGRTPAEIEEIYMHMFGFIKKKIEALDFNDINSEEDCRKFKTNFNIPRIFKLFTTSKRIENVKAKIGKINSPNVQGVNINNNAEGGVEE